MTEQRTAQHWRVLVGGVEQANVGPGESLEIGRRPLRPLPDDGHRRFEVDDKTRSMSKRHALLEVGDDGSASVTDLNSTNGSYRVDTAGLIGLTPRQPFALAAPAVHLQFGDVPVDFVCADASDDEPDRRIEIADLFDYAAPGASPEPDMGDLSVDDILNLRAGEPTRVFDAGEVASRIHKPGADAQSDDGVSQAGTSDEAAQSDSIARTEESSVPDEAQAGQVGEAQEPADAVEALSVNIAVTPADEPQVVQSRNLFEDAKSADMSDQQPRPQSTSASVAMQAGVSAPVGGGVPAQSSGVPVSSGLASSVSGPIVAGPARQSSYDAAHLDALIPERPTADAQPMGQTLPQQAPSHPVHQIPAQVQTQPQHQPQQQDQWSTQPQAQQNQQQPQSQPVVQTRSPEQTQHEDQLRFQPQAQTQAQAQPTAMFEPGSIFEKVSNGEFDQVGQAVEVDGLSSEDARKAEDFTVQFEMAKHEQLLPFLAMNPSLYDDLYAWLEAQGNQDIDTALSHNPGYKHYRDASGKGTPDDE